MGVPKTNEEFIKELSIKNPTVIPLEEYNGAFEKIYVKRTTCEHVCHQTPNNLLHGRGCTYCRTLKRRINQAKKGNCIAITHPHLAKLLKNPEEAYLYSYGSEQVTCWICPECGEEVYKSFEKMCKNGFSCPKCGDGIKYPNKFMYNILTELNIDFIREYTPDWLNGKRFDFYFKLNNKEYVIEMDGYFHYHDNFFKYNDKSYNSKEIDDYKDKQARERNIIVIRIDCDYSSNEDRFVYILKNIKQSLLSELFNLDECDFEKCNKEAQTTFIKEISRIWDSGVHNLLEIQEITGLCATTVRKYLRLSEEFGLSTFCEKEFSEQLEQNRIKSLSHGRIRNCLYLCYQTGEIFNTMTEASKKYHGDVWGFFNDKTRQYAGTLPDGTRLTWERIPKTK